MTRAALVVVFLVASAAATSAAPLPKAQLRAVADVSTVELRTVGRKSGQPRSVTIWFVVDEQEQLFVQSGSDGGTDWYRNLLKTPSVSFQIETLRGRATAVPVHDDAETARVHELFRKKYLRARVLGWFGGQTGRGKVVQLTDLAEP